MVGGYVVLGQTPIRRRADIRPEQIARFDG